MFAVVCVFLVMLLLVTRRIKGPVWAMSITWLICILPIAINLIRYEYLSLSSIGYPLVLIGYLSCFAIGSAAVAVTTKYTRRNAVTSGSVELAVALPWAYVAWSAAAIGTACLCIDFASQAGAGLGDIAELRSIYVSKDGATVLARIASILTWGCLYSFVFALTFREQLSRWWFALFLFPIVGYFLVSLFSAGRQTAMQIVIFSLLTMALRSARNGRSGRRERKGYFVPLAISAAMIVFMGFIAVVRNDGVISTDKVEVLEVLFDFETAPFFSQVLGYFGESVRTAIVEALVYFSSSIALFSKFLTIDLREHFFGAMSLPFVFRQIEPITGISVIGALQHRVELMNGAGVIGVGWTTGISSYILDFGVTGAACLLVLQGYYSNFTWCRARRSRDFNDGVIALVMLSVAAYMPLLAASGDTNLLLLWFFSVIARIQTHRKAHMPHM